MKIFTILSLLTVPVSLGLGAALAPTPTATSIATLTLGNDAAQNDWKVYALDRSPGDIPPSFLANFELKACNVEIELDTRAAGQLIVSGSLCSSNGCTAGPDMTLNSGGKANFPSPANLIRYRGGTPGCHITLYDRANEQVDGSEIRILFSAVATNVAFSLPTGGPRTVRSIGYFC